MKKICFLFLSLLPLLAMSGKVEKSYQFSNWSVRETGIYQTVTFSGTMVAGLTGEPALPYQAVSMMLPPGEKAIAVEFHGEELTEIPGVYTLYPQQEMQPISEGNSGRFVKKEAVYRMDGAYPASQTGNLITSYLNGYGFALTTFTPVVYHPATGKLAWYRSVAIVIHTAPDPAAAEALQNLTVSGKATDRVLRLAQNPGMIRLYPQKEAPVTGYQILIITPEQYQTGFQPLIDYYNTRGMQAQVATTEMIAASVQGEDQADKIRNYIRSEYQQNAIGHVILGGDVPLIPYRGFYCYVISGSGYEDNDIPADIYFSALDGNWNANGNSKWGEPGEEDLLPEISVGRMSFSNATELQHMVNKSINYQSNPGSWDMDKPYLVSEYLYDQPPTWGADYLELLIDDHMDNGYFTHGIPSADNNITRLYDTPGFNWSTGQVISGCNAGKSFIHHSGHSNSDYMMRLYIWDVTDQNFSQVNGIAQNFQLMYTHGCICGAFDTEDCIAERGTSIANWLAGGVFNSRYGWFNQGQTEGPSAHLHREFISAVYNPDPDSAIAELGAAHTMSKIMTAPWIALPGEFEPGAQRWCFYDCNVLGDPAMKVLPDDPSVGNNEYLHPRLFTVSPNPCRDRLTIRLSMPVQGDLRISLVNESGQEVFVKPVGNTGVNSTVSFSISGIVPGVYTCKLTGIDRTGVQKVIVTP